MNDYIALYDSKLKKKCDIDWLVWNKNRMNYLAILASHNLMAKHNVSICLNDIVLLYQNGFASGYRVTRENNEENHSVFFCDDIIEDFRYCLLREKETTILTPIEHMRKVISHAARYGSEFWKIGSACVDVKIKVTYKALGSVSSVLNQILYESERATEKRLKYSTNFDNGFVLSLVVTDEELYAKEAPVQSNDKLSDKRRKRASDRRETMLNAIVEFLRKRGSSKSRDIQDYLENEGILKVGAPGNQPTLSRFISKEVESKDSPIVKEGSGVVSLRK